MPVGLRGLSIAATGVFHGTMYTKIDVASLKCLSLGRIWKKHAEEPVMEAASFRLSKRSCDQCNDDAVVTMLTDLISVRIVIGPGKGWSLKEIKRAWTFRRYQVHQRRLYGLRDTRHTRQIGQARGHVIRMII